MLNSITPLTGQPLTQLKSVIDSKEKLVRNWTQLIEHQCKQINSAECAVT